MIIGNIKQKYKIRNTDIIQNLSDYLMDNVSNITSANNIGITDKTVNNYIEYLCNSFAFYKIKGKKLLNVQNKYSLVDHSFKYALLGTSNMNYGRIYENIVLMELLRRGYEVYKGKKIYIQVSDDISNENTFKREVNSLLKIQDAYTKMIIARTRHDTYQYEEIDIVHITNWLNEKS